MAIKLSLNKWGFTALAKEFRYASWGIAAFAAGSHFNNEQWVSYTVAAIAWFALQAFAFFIESIKIDVEPPSRRYIQRRKSGPEGRS